MAKSKDKISSKDYYLQTWKQMLGEFLGWSEFQVREWANRYYEFLDDPHDIFYHETPQYWAVNILIPDSLKTQLEIFDKIDLEHRILAVFNEPFDYPIDTNWKPYKAKIEQILGEYGERFPQLIPQEAPR